MCHIACWLATRACKQHEAAGTLRCFCHTHIDTLPLLLCLHVVVSGVSPYQIALCTGGFIKINVLSPSLSSLSPSPHGAVLLYLPPVCLRAVSLSAFPHSSPKTWGRRLPERLRPSWFHCRGIKTTLMDTYNPTSMTLPSFPRISEHFIIFSDKISRILISYTQQK